MHITSYKMSRIKTYIEMGERSREGDAVVSARTGHINCSKNLLVDILAAVEHRFVSFNFQLLTSCVVFVSLRFGLSVCVFFVQLFTLSQFILLWPFRSAFGVFYCHTLLNLFQCRTNAKTAISHNALSATVFGTIW